jgi:hypothetical protein
VPLSGACRQGEPGVAVYHVTNRNYWIFVINALSDDFSLSKPFVPNATELRQLAPERDESMPRNFTVRGGELSTVEPGIYPPGPGPFMGSHLALCGMSPK